MPSVGSTIKSKELVIYTVIPELFFTIKLYGFITTPASTPPDSCPTAGYRLTVPNSGYQKFVFFKILQVTTTL